MANDLFSTPDERDRTKMLKLHKDFTSIEKPEFEDQETAKIANTVFEGLKMMKEWLEAEAKRKFQKKQ